MVASRQPASVPLQDRRAVTNKDLVKRVKPPEMTDATGAGFLTGPIFSFAKGDPPSPGNTRNAFSFGVFLDQQMTDTFYFCPELAYVQRGVHTQLYSFSGFQVAGDVKLTYIELPILVKAKFHHTRKIRTFVTAGPNFGLAIGREVEVLGLVNLDLAQRFSQYDFSMIVGGGAEFNLSHDIAFVGTARYTHGLVDIDTTDEASYQTRSIQLLFGLRMGL